MHIHIIRMLYSVWRLYLLYNTLGVLSDTLSHKSLYILKTETELSTISNHDIEKLICSETINLSNGIKKKFSPKFLLGQTGNPKLHYKTSKRYY